MNMATLLFKSLVIIMFPTMSWSWSVIDDHARTYQFKGKVKAIALVHNIKVKMVSDDPEVVGREQVYTLCVPNGRTYKDDPRQVMMMETIKEAFRTGQSLKINYDSLFDKCLEDVQLVNSGPGVHPSSVAQDL